MLFLALRRVLPGLAAVLLLSTSAWAQPGVRARDLGVALPGTPGPLNAITDVAGVAVGHTTIIEGAGKLVRGQGPIRTGVTAILPRGQAGPDSTFASWYRLNGNGEMTGVAWLEESGILDTPVLITNTHSVGVARDAAIEWMLGHRPGFSFALPVVAETADGLLNDMNGFHVQRSHVLGALDAARPGPVAEGNVGGGTGMICHGFKAGIGTSSRVIQVAGGRYTLGVLTQCNYGARPRFRVDGVPVGEAIPNSEVGICLTVKPEATTRFAGGRFPECGPGGSTKPGLPGPLDDGAGSIIVVVATDAPLLPHQLQRLTRRVALAVGRMGGLGENSSGDIFLAFSTANRSIGRGDSVVALAMVPNALMNPLFEATVQATEESILNAMVAAETMVGADGVRVPELPHDRLREIMAAARRR
ncbi:MAG: P1 family peptidase [Gemmatimonadales bacterium]|nr:P1 family peptidase [Gemmatimonadales bacterium]